MDEPKTTDVESVKVQSLVPHWIQDSDPKQVITGQNATTTPGSAAGVWNVSGELPLRL